MTKIVAEISGNHGGQIVNAHRLIVAAKNAGADAVKFQCFEPGRLAARRSGNQEVLRLAGISGDRIDAVAALIDLYRRTHTPKVWFPQLINQAQSVGLKWFSSVFDPADVAFLETLDCPRYKISAFEMLDWDIIKAVKETGKPIVLSVRPVEGVTIMQATDYDGWHPPYGLSSHSPLRLPGPGAPMVEYHLRLEGVDTPDKSFSLTEAQLRINVQLIREMENSAL